MHPKAFNSTFLAKKKKPVEYTKSYLFLTDDEGVTFGSYQRQHQCCTLRLINIALWLSWYGVQSTRLKGDFDSLRYSRLNDH